MFTMFVLLGGLLTPASATATALMRPQMVVGPHGALGAIDSLNGLAIAPDGSGGMVFLETISGVPHVFVSRLQQGAWHPPEQVDVGLSAASSQPQIVADDNGELVVAFVNSGAVYVSRARNGAQPLSAPQLIATGATHPSVSLNSYGVGYLAYTAQDGAGYDVDVDYFDGKAWYPANPHAVNVTAADNAGTGNDAPDVVAAGDGVGIVAWGEDGHVYTRRVWGTATSVQTQQIDPSSVAGWSEVTADRPRISVGGNSSYPVVVFREEVASAGRTQSRVLAEGLVAETAGIETPVDDLAAGPMNATQPRVAMNYAGYGFITAATSSNQLIATPVVPFGYIETPGALLPGGGRALPYAVPANAGGGHLIAWQETPKRGSPRIVVSYPRNVHRKVGPSRSTGVSEAVKGPTDAALGLLAAGDGSGDAAVAWVQGSARARSIDAAELIAGPGSTGAPQPFAYTRHSTPVLRWPAAHESWGPLSYRITLDGSVIGRTDQLAWQVRKPLRDGRHAWALTSINEGSESSIGTVQTLFVDTHPPFLHASLTGTRAVGRTLRLTMSYADLPNPKQPGSTASGVASATVKWGASAVPVNQAGHSRVSRRIQDHHVYYTATMTNVYRRGGHQTVTAAVTDRAGNRTTLTWKLVIAPGPKGRST
jgi:hypothetical protein